MQFLIFHAISPDKLQSVAWSSDQVYTEDYPYAGYLRNPMTHALAEVLGFQDTLSPIATLLRKCNKSLAVCEVTLGRLENHLKKSNLITDSLGPASYTHTEGYAYRCNDAFITLTRLGDEYHLWGHRKENISDWIADTTK